MDHTLLVAMTILGSHCRHLPQRAAHLLAIDQRRHVVARTVGAACFDDERLLESPAASGTAALHQEHMARDGERPRRDRAARFIRPPRSMELHEGVLDKIVCERRVAAERIQVTAEASSQRGVDRVERVEVSFEVTVHQAAQLGFRLGSAIRRCRSSPDVLCRPTHAGYITPVRFFSAG